MQAASARRCEAGQPDGTAAVLVDLEISMRTSAPLPPATPMAELRRAVHRAERDYSD